MKVALNGNKIQVINKEKEVIEEYKKPKSELATQQTIKNIEKRLNSRYTVTRDNGLFWTKTQEMIMRSISGSRYFK